jgi:hypothetical protein
MPFASSYDLTVAVAEYGDELSACVQLELLFGDDHPLLHALWWVALGTATNVLYV